MKAIEMSLVDGGEGAAWSGGWRRGSCIDGVPSNISNAGWPLQLSRRLRPTFVAVHVPVLEKKKGGTN